MTDVLATTRCPQCTALVRPGQPWCTLCHSDLQPAPAYGAEPAREPVPVEPDPHPPASADQLTDALGVPDDPVTAAPGPTIGADPSVVAGRHARRAALAEPPGPGGSRTEPSDREVEAMLAELALQTGDPLGGVAGRLGSRSAKVAVALGLCLGAMALMLLGSVVLAAVLG